MSAGAASRRCAAIFFPLPMTLTQAVCSAEPPTAIEREPKVPVPTGTDAVSPSRTARLLGGRPRQAWKVGARDQASTSTGSLISNIHLAFFSREEASAAISGLTAGSSGFRDFASRANGSSAFA